MPPKNEPAPAPAPAAPAPAAPVAAPLKFSALLPVIMVVILAPVISWALAQFVLLPSMEKRLNAAVANATIANEAVEATPVSVAEPSGHGAKGKDAPPANSYEFTNMVVNLAGTMGTRYLKVTFLVTGKDQNLRNLFLNDKPRQLDITLNVLSSLTLADLEEAGAKNIIREKLVNAYNQAFGKRVVEQIYFSDFVVQ